MLQIMVQTVYPWRVMHKNKAGTAQSMLAEGLDPALVARVIKLPKKQILTLR
jgi:hypothetical protein